jgi:hypothetical protein
MRNKHSPDFLHFQSKPGHTPESFTAGNTGINKHSIMLITNIIAIPVTP